MVTKFSLKLAFPLLACTLPLLVSAQVYTWKDANGRTNFADQPPSGSNAKTMRGNIVPPDAEPPRAAASAPSTNASAPKDAKASGPKTWEDQDREFKQRKAEQAEADAKAKKEAEAKAQKTQYCNSLRSNLAMLERGGRISSPDAKGEPNYLSDKQMSSEADRLRGQIAKDCK